MLQVSDERPVSSLRRKALEGFGATECRQRGGVQAGVYVSDRVWFLLRGGVCSGVSFLKMRLALSGGFKFLLQV